MAVMGGALFWDECRSGKSALRGGMAACYVQCSLGAGSGGGVGGKLLDARQTGAKGMVKSSPRKKRTSPGPIHLAVMDRDLAAVREAIRRGEDVDDLDRVEGR